MDDGAQRRPRALSEVQRAGLDVLNRLFIVIGVLAILALSAAFAVPRLVQWGQYRDRIEAAASEALGTKVEIVGDIHFSLLPSPQLQLSHVVVGPRDQPVLAVDGVSAELSLTDFLRDRFAITKLVLQSPRFDLDIDRRGNLVTNLALARQMDDAGLSVANAKLVNGVVAVRDQRSGRTSTIDDIDGDISISNLRGPFTFQGAGQLGGRRYSARIATSELDKNGTTQVTVTARPVTGDATLALAGVLITGRAPNFVGDLTYRRSPGQSAVKAGVGDLVLTGKFDATPEKLSLADATLKPDENQAVTQLSGRATITLGSAPRFDAEVHSRVISQPPRPPSAEDATEPYEWVRLLTELSLPPVPPIAGRLKLDIAALDLRAMSLRNLDADLTFDGTDWTIDKAEAMLNGDTRLALAGTLTAAGTTPGFDGKVSMDTGRLDTLASLWRPNASSSPLYGVPASLTAKVSLHSDELTVTNGQFMLDRHANTFSAVAALVGTRSLDITTHLAKLTPGDSAIVQALLPAMGQGSPITISFPQGTVTASAEAATLFGLEGEGLSGKAEWGATGLHVSDLKARAIGGATLSGSFSLAGELSAPQLSGQATIGVDHADAPALKRLEALVKAPASLRAVLDRSVPARLLFRLNEQGPNGDQTANLTGEAGGAQLDLTADMAQGVATALAGHLALTLKARADDPAALTRQLGLGDTSLMPAGAPTKIAASLDGTVAKGFEASLSVDGGGDSIDYKGSVTLADTTAPTADGTVKVALSDPTSLVRLIVGDGITLPPLKGSADLIADGSGSLALVDLKGRAGGATIDGHVALHHEGDQPTVDGALHLSGLDIPALTAQLAGPTALIETTDQVWPEGPFSIGDAPRPTVGDVAVTADSMATGGPLPLTDPGFHLVWDQKTVRIKGFSGNLGQGTVSGEASICCAGPEPDKTVNANATFADIASEAVLPAATGNVLSGMVSGVVSISGSGASIADVLGGLGGSGTVNVTDLEIDKFDPKAFEAVAGLTDIVDVKPEDLTSLMAVALDKGPFATPKVTAGFAIANGVLRLSNVAADAPGGHLFGNLDVNLANLGLNGSFALSPVGIADPNGLVSAETARVTALVSGRLTAPSRTLDLTALVDAIKVRAYELEVARLEKLKAEDDARRKAAADEQARQQAADKAAADAAAKADAEAAAKQKAEETTPSPPAQQQVQPAAPPSSSGQSIEKPPVPRPVPDFTLLGPLDLGIPQPGYAN